MQEEGDSQATSRSAWSLSFSTVARQADANAAQSGFFMTVSP